MVNNPFLPVINQLLPEPQASLLTGIVFGVRSSIPKNLYEALITTGTIHIIALSGQNISILTKIISEFTLSLGRRVSIWLTILTITAFVFFVGLEPSIIRAAIMGSISLLAIYFGRQAWSLLSLLLAASIMLLINPDWIGDISFQLSFLATLGIILFGKIQNQPVKTIWDEVKRELYISGRTTISAQIFTIPLVWIVFKQISLIAPVTNILIGFLISPIMVIGLLLGVVGWLFLPLAIPLAWLVWVPLTVIVEVVELTSQIPYAAIKF